MQYNVYVMWQDTRAHAEAARVALDGVLKKGRNIRVRFASLGAAIKLHYLPNYASNELLEKAFESFGEVEYAVVVVDDRGKATGDGIIEFARKPSALQALKRIQEGVFLLSRCVSSLLCRWFFMFSEAISSFLSDNELFTKNIAGILLLFLYCPQYSKTNHG